MVILKYSDAPRAPWLLVLILALVAGACDFPDFDPPNQIKKTRVLAIRVEPREAAPGEEVLVTGLAVTKDGEAYEGPITWLATAGAQLLAGESDELPQGMYHLQLSPELPFTFTIPRGEAFTEIFGEYDPEGTVLTIAMAIGDLKKDPILAIKSLVVKDQPTKENPIFQSLTFLVNGEDIPPDEDGLYHVGNVGRVKVIAQVDFPTGDEETYHWYTTTEGLEFKVEKSTTWRLPKKPGEYVIHCVARENTSTILGGGDYSIKSAGIDWTTARIVISSGLDEIP